MVNTRKTEDFTSNPAFTAAVQRTVDALLPDLTARIRDEVRRETANGGGVLEQNPRSFRSGTTPADAEYWIAHIEKIFEVLGCGDVFKARLASYEFEGDALNWWTAYKYAKGGDDFVVTLSWIDIRETFFQHYFPLSKKEKFEREYHTIYQLDRDNNNEFMKRFVQLAGFLGPRAGTQAEQAKKFKWALRNDTLEGIVNTHFEDVAQVRNAARNIEIVQERSRNGVKRNHDGDRVRSGQGNNPRGTTRGIVTTGQGAIISIGISSIGISGIVVDRIIVLLVRMGREKMGIRMPTRRVGGYILVDSVIGLLGLVSYVARWGIWLEIVPRQAASASGTVSGTLRLFDDTTFTLFDTGATHLVISNLFAKHINTLATPLKRVLICLANELEIIECVAPVSNKVNDVRSNKRRVPETVPEALAA
ncbi:zinc finger, CCHC-type, Retrotransposon gag domain protein [Artemisia annua]|uniref:Zinc finger, CCHC-type, Retrotransposon gag domain protein n=1 Tax=Artemisia annua TaxID=35608 RepID=A0A2U1MMP5_ARTAN|nr:zinc finger, CCHC-type, Retrotransposon gag domain protein [Artemisia annua]